MSTASIGSLAVMLSANASGFVSGVNRATSNTRKFSTTANRNIATVGGALERLGGVAKRIAPLMAAAFGVGAMTRQLSRLDEIGKTADRLGFTAEQLSRLQFAGEQTGVAVNTMNMALQRMTRRVAEAAAGTGEAKDAIAELGLDAQALNTMGPAKAFAALSDAIKKVKNPSDRVRLAMKLFDSEGVRLVNTMNLGSKGLEEMARRSDELGRTVSGKAAKSAAEFNDAMNELKSAVGGAAAGLLTAMIPALKQLVDLLTSAFAGVNRLIAGLKSLFSSGFTGEWTVVRQLKEANAEAANTNSMFELLRKRITDLATEKQYLDDMAEQGTGGLARWGNLIDVTLGGVAKRFVDVTSGWDALESQAKAIFEATRTPMERFKSQLKELQDLQRKGLLDTDTFNRAVQQAKARIEVAVGQVADPQLAANRVSFAAMGAEAAAGRGQDKLEKNTAEEVKVSKSIDTSVKSLVEQGLTQKQLATVIVKL